MRSKTELAINNELKQEIEEIHLKIVKEVQTFAKSWYLTAHNLRSLQSKIGKHSKQGWKNYLDVESFEDYCNLKLGLSSKTCYQWIESLNLLEKTSPDLIDNINSDDSILIPDWTKIRLLTTRKVKSLSKTDPAVYQELVNEAINENPSKRELEKKVEIATCKLPSSKKMKRVDPIKVEINNEIMKSKSKLVKAVKDKNIYQINNWTRTLVAGSKLVDSTRVESIEYKRIIITPSVAELDYTVNVINRIKKKSPDIDIVQSGNEQPNFPSQLSADGKYWYMKESLVLTSRKSPFFSFFPSPGDVVENLGTLLILSWHCRAACEFCYLQASKRQWQELYMNLDDLDNQINIELYVYRAVLTIWSAISFYNEQPVYKLPDGLKKAGDKMRIKFIADKINSNEKAIQYLELNIENIFLELGMTIDDSNFKSIIKNISDYYDKNKKYKPAMNISEYTDIIATDEFSGYMEYLLQILPNYPEFNLNIRTKFSNIDDMLKYPGNNQVRFTMNFNTEYAIKNHELGTSKLIDRIKAAKKIQNADGYRFKIIIEPILYYNECEEDYINLAKTLMSELDTNNIEDISISMVRFKKALTSIIKRNYATTNLFDNKHKLIDPIKPDTRIRYDFDWRVDLSKKLIAIFRTHSDAPIRTGGDIAEFWDAVGLDKTGHIKDSVYMYSE